MKVESEVTEKKFSPITLTITIQNKRELELLWSIFNCTHTDIVNLANKERSGRIKVFQVGDDKISEPIWKELDKHF